MKHSPQFRSKREEERAAAKNTVGYKMWSVLFTVMYPFIAVFTFVFSCIVMFFSGISRVLAYVLGRSHAKH